MQTRQLHNGGRIGALPALDAEPDALVAEQAVADGAADSNADQITLVPALEGGWNDPEPAQAPNL